MKRRSVSLAVLAASPIAWTLTASAFLSNMAHVPFAWNLWWQRLDWWGVNWWCDVLMAGSAATPTAVLLLVLLVAALAWRSGSRQQSVYGDTGWADTPKEMRQGGVKVSRRLP
jgi:hypothetical protein